MTLIKEPWEVYHARRSEHVTAHSLATFRRCPLEFHLEQTGELTKPDSPQFAFGRASHCLILEGEAALQEQYVVGAPINPKTQKPYGRDTQAYAAWLSEQTKPVISTEELELAAAMKASIENHDIACRLLSSGEAEGVLRGEWNGVQCQSRLDWYSEDAGIADLKTTEDLDRFEKDARNFCYPEQMAFYYGLGWELGLEPEAATIIACEKRAPHRVGVWRMSDVSLRALVDRCKSDLGAVAEAHEKGEWRTRYEDMRWM